MKTRKVYLTWDDFDAAVTEIANHFRNKGITQIVGVSRGGLPLAVALSHRLDVPMTSLKWQTRDGDIRELVKLKRIRDIESTLFVDDIFDSGLTINQIKSYIPSSRWCTWITKNWNAVEFSVEDFSNENDIWLVFPWENKN